MKFKKWIRHISLALVIVACFSYLSWGAEGKVAVTFEYEPPGEVNKVYLAGNFNGWSPTATEMQDEDGDGVYKVTIKLEPGKYSYKYVINGNQWQRPPKADGYEDDGMGGRNGIIKVQGTRNRTSGNQITTNALRHNKNNLSYAKPVGERKIKIKFRARKDNVQEVVLYYNDSRDKTAKMEKYLSNSRYDYYQTTIKVAQANFGYCFGVKNDGQTVWYDGQGIKDNKDNLRLINYNLDQQTVFKTPDWVKDAIFYYIFPDRFYNGNPDNDPEKVDVYKTQNSLYRGANPDWHQGIPNTKSHVLFEKNKFMNNNNQINPNYGYHAFYGGDLQGIEEKISYLKELGINAVNLGPVFESLSNDKYNTAGYKLIEDSFAVQGDQEASRQYFRKLIQKLHANGIKVILDVAFNHTGYEHWAFQDVVENGKSSEYSDWYFIQDYPVKKLYNQGPNNPPNYRCWWGFGSLPVLNLNNSEVKEYLFSATKKWMDPDGDGDPSDGIDGWRLDVPEQVKDTNPQFLQEWRQFVKKVNPQAYITGDVQKNSGEYLNGKEFDGVLNHRFRQAVIDFIVKKEINAEEFASQMTEMKFNYPAESRHSVQNLLGLADTKRFLTVAGGNKDQLTAASFLQFTHLGTPLIYYGDEVGLKGGLPPDSRRTMLWENRGYTRPDEELREHYQRLIDIRKREPALRRGSLKQIPLENEMVYAFKRNYQEDSLLVLVNAGTERAKVAVPVDLPSGEYKELYSEQMVEVEVGKLRMDLPAGKGAIVKLKAPEDAEAKTKEGYKFVFDPERYGVEVDKEVHVVGGMNGWEPSNKDYALTKQDNGLWTGVFDVKKGTEFKFVVDGDTWDSEVNDSEDGTGPYNTNFKVGEDPEEVKPVN